MISCFLKVKLFDAIIVHIINLGLSFRPHPLIVKPNDGSLCSLITVPIPQNRLKDIPIVWYSIYILSKYSSQWLIQNLDIHWLSRDFTQTKSDLTFYMLHKFKQRQTVDTLYSDLVGVYHLVRCSWDWNIVLQCSSSLLPLYTVVFWSEYFWCFCGQ